MTAQSQYWLARDTAKLKGHLEGIGINASDDAVLLAAALANQTGQLHKIATEIESLLETTPERKVGL